MSMRCLCVILSVTRSVGQARTDGGSTSTQTDAEHTMPVPALTPAIAVLSHVCACRIIKQQLQRRIHNKQRPRRVQQLRQQQQLPPLQIRQQPLRLLRLRPLLRLSLCNRLQLPRLLLLRLIQWTPFRRCPLRFSRPSPLVPRCPCVASMMPRPPLDAPCFRLRLPRLPSLIRSRPPRCSVRARPRHRRRCLPPRAAGACCAAHR